MLTPRRISVALCIFNGEPFLAGQLDSLKKQSRLPDELVACDDGSTDRSMEILRQFAADSPFPVHIHRNDTILGPAGNFESAINHCTGDIISLCDQDDIWSTTKIAATEAAFVQNPNLAFVFTDAEICDAACNPLGYRLWTSVGFTGHLLRRFQSGQGFDVLLRQNVVTGATLSFASQYRSLLLPVGRGWMHDGWIALLLSAVSTGQPIDQPLIRYRQHANQSIGAQRRSLYQQYLNAKKMDRAVFADQADQFEVALQRLQEDTSASPHQQVIHHLQEKIQHCRKRSAIRQRETSRLLPAMTELIALRYRRFSLGWRSFAQDLFL